MAQFARRVFLNGSQMALEDARISPLDRGFMFADSVYEVMLIRDGTVSNLDRHLQRLMNSLKALQIRNPHTPLQWREHITSLVTANEMENASLYLQVSRGVAPFRALFQPEPMHPTVFMLMEPLPVIPGEGRGVTAGTTEDLRWEWCNVKVTGLTANLIMRMVNRKVDEVILHRAGEVTEGASSNVFALVDGKVITPPLSQWVLPGVTRGLLLEILAEEQIDFEEKAMRLETLKRADELWISSTLYGIAPVIELDGLAVGNGTPGPLCRRLTPLLEAKRSEERADTGIAG